MNARNNQHKITNSNLARKGLMNSLVAAGILAVSGLGGAYAAPDKLWKAGQILVKPRTGLPTNEFNKVLRRNNAQSQGVIGSLGVHIISVPEHAEAAVVQALSRNPHIEFAEMDKAVALSAFTPNDPRLNDAWHLSKVQADVAWDYATGEGITIAILDTGVDGAHPDLAEHMVAGWNSVDGNNDTAAVHWHGTAVAGTAAAIGNNGIGITSIAWNADIMPIRVSNAADGYAFWSDIARGLNWAADHGADIANISYDATTSSSISKAAQQMYSQGGVVVVAAGNAGIDPNYSDNPYIISVAATDSTDNKASWSNYGNYIDVAAPGVSILATMPGGTYGSVSGTSFASPATAGVVALIMSANPSLNAAEVENVLEASADKVAGAWHPYYGNGRVNAATAVQMALNMDNAPIDQQVPTVNIFSPVVESIAQGIVQVEVSAFDNVGVASVSLYANNQYIGTDMTTPYQFSWDSNAFADGDVTLTAIADDAAGNEGTSASVSVSVDNIIDVVDIVPPVVTISNPTDGSSVKRTVNILVYAQDDVAVGQIKLFIDGDIKATVNGESLSFGWNTRKASDGEHSINIVATDAANNSTSKSIVVMIGGGSNDKKGGGGRGKNK
ncbi:MAG: thermitase [Methyloprofundus sp.]|nr:MAG: thermitase [Methyloprofundus sp.]